MPAIVVKDYTWRQTPEEIIISVALTGKPRKVDIFACGNYLKASYPPFILELFLYNEILEDTSACTLTEELAIFTLKKSEVGQEWPTLTVENFPKDEQRKCRIRALERSQVSAEKLKEKRREKQQLLQRQAVRQQIECDTRVCDQIQELRDGHRKEAMTDFEEFRQNAEVPIFAEETGVLQENRKQYKAPIKWFNDSQSSVSGPPPIEDCGEEEIAADKITECSETPAKILESSEAPENEENYDTIRGKKIIDDILRGKYGNSEIFDDMNTPQPRQSATINVTFSERVFPTPARESNHLEEQEWLGKQAEARRKCGFATEDLSQEEQDPQWLKDKGDNFFKVGNYLAAVSAYTHGIKLSGKMSSLYANRAAAQYALGNYKRCAEDSSQALELMVPKCEGNRDSRARCHARLGAALCKLSAPQHGIPEFEEALKLAPENDTIRRDLEEAKHYFHLHNYQA